MVEDLFSTIIGWGIGSIVEFFAVAALGWWNCSSWVMRPVVTLIHPVRPWYVPSSISIPSLSYYEKISDIFPSGAMDLITCAARAFACYSPFIIGSPTRGGASKIDEMVYGIDSISVSKRFYNENNSTAINIFHGQPLGMRALPAIKRMLTPDNPFFYSLAPHVGTHKGFWSGDQGRIAFYFSPIIPYVATNPAYIPPDLISQLLGVSPTTASLIVRACRLVVRPGLVSGGKTDWWDKLAKSGVIPAARALTYNFVHLITGWCAKAFISIIGSVTSFAPVMSHFFKELAKKTGIYPLLYKLIKFMTPIDNSTWNETLPVDPYNPTEIYYDIVGKVKALMTLSSKAPSLGSFTIGGGLGFLITLSQAILMYNTSNRVFTDHVGIIACPVDSVGVTSTICAEECSHFLTFVLWYPSGFSDILSEDDPGTVIDVETTQANEDGAKIAMSQWASRLIPSGVAILWVKYSKYFEDMYNKIDDMLDHLKDKMSDLLENNPSAPYRQSLSSSAYGIDCAGVGSMNSIPSWDDLVGGLANGNFWDEVADGVGKLLASMLLNLSLYVGGGTPGLALFWWSPQINPPVWVSRSITLATIDPISICKGIIELVLTLPHQLWEDYEDWRKIIKSGIDKALGFLGKK